MEDKKRIVIYGLGNNFKKYYTERIACNLQREFNVIGMVDKKGDFPEEVLADFSCYQWMGDLEYDYICITSTAYYDEIKKELMMQSVNENKILPDHFWNQFCEKSYIPMALLKGKGVEIGGPSELFQIIYHSGYLCDGVNYDSRTVWNDNSGIDYKWKDKIIGKQMIADATDLQLIKDATYDFVLSSNNLEHIANPMKAISEFVRILKKDGLIIILVPCKDYTFDHERAYTTFEHILDDYKKDVLEDDLTHLEEILEKHDLELDYQAGTKDKFRTRSKNNFKNRCLHHHVFHNELLADIASYFDLEIIENTIFCRNYYLVARKGKCRGETLMYLSNL